jgi:hypothetical protein
MDSVLERIAAWQADGLIDAATADRLRAAEAETATSLAEDSPRTRTPVGAASSFFGPAPTIVEAFVYLGAGFFVGAWSAFLARIAGESADRSAIMTAGSALAVAVLFGLGLVLRTGDARRRRGAGVAFLTATIGAAFAAEFLGQVLKLESRPVAAIVDAGAAVALAIVGRRLLPAVTTQLALLGSLTGLAAAVFKLLEPIETFPVDCCETYVPPIADPIRLVLVPAIGWLIVALGLGLLGLAEARSGSDPAGRRAAVTRFWAGLLAVIGVATAVFRQGYIGQDVYGRVIAPWMAEVVLFVLAAILLERALRRDSAAFVVAGAIALVAALTDFNFTYLSSSTDIGLLIEGAILLAVGFGADRLRRRLGGGSDGPSPTIEAAALPPA